MVQVTESNGGPGRSRTADQRFRKPLLYPTELRGRCSLTRLSHAGLPKQALGVPDLVSGIANIFSGKPIRTPRADGKIASAGIGTG
jgi:hypothetical protein